MPTGRVYYGEVPLIAPKLSPEFELLLSWADEIRELGVRANADTPGDARKAREFGAEGIGLCRTEHMFLNPERLPLVQEMILAESQEEREAALVKLLLLQQGDFEQILREMEGLPARSPTDPPAEFLPNWKTAGGGNPYQRAWRRGKRAAAKESLLKSAQPGGAKSCSANGLLPGTCLRNLGCSPGSSGCRSFKEGRPGIGPNMIPWGASHS